MGRRRRRSNRQSREAIVWVNWIRTPIASRNRQRLLVILIYARFSTDEQRPRSIKAQVEFCKRFLKAAGVTNFRIEIISDEGLSGELRDRPGINKVWAGIRKKLWNMIVVEDSSRIYRDDVACLDIVRTAFDNDIRTICIDDFVDTADADWEDRLKEAARRHAASNRHTALRIKRAHEELWYSGAAIGKLQSGYIRKPSVPATEDAPAEGPFFDEIDPKLQPLIEEAYERSAAKELPKVIGEFLKREKLPRVGKSGRTDWDATAVIALLRRKDYRGVQEYRKTVVRKELTTGKHKPEKNAPEEILTRDMPNLRMVSDSLWFAGNAPIDNRARHKNPARGRDNNLYGIPRDSRGPLSGVFFCTCGAKMRLDARREGGYRCSNARTHDCWNRATALRDKTHEAIGSAICERLQSFDTEIDRLLDQVKPYLTDTPERANARLQLEQRRAKLRKKVSNLTRAIERGKSKLPSLVSRLELVEDQLANVEAKLGSLTRRDVDFAIPTRHEIKERIAHLVELARRMDRDSRDELLIIVEQIHAIPYMQFGSTKVVLRARFAIRFAGLLPARTRAALAEILGATFNAQFESIPIQVDLFIPSTGPQYFQQALKLKNEERLGLTAIGRRLGDISKRRANLAVQYGKALAEAGRSDPYTELTEAPAFVGRWKPRSPRQPDSDSQAS